MPDFGIYAGDTNKTIYVRLRDSTTGLAKTGLAYNDANAVLSYTLPLAARAAITLATQTVTGAHSDGGFVEVDATNCKGLYRVDLSDAAIASGAFTIISIEFDGTIEESIEIPLHTRKVNVTEWLGTAAATPTVAGVPEVDLTHVMGTILTETAGGRLAAAIIKLFDVATPTLVASDVMRGTDSANTTVPDAAGTAPTAIENRQEMDSNSTKLAAAALEATLTAMKGATFSGATDSLEAIRNRGDSAWPTATGFNTVVPDAAGTAPTTAEIWAAITDAASNKIADHILRRSAATARASSDGDTADFRSLLGAVSKLVNRIKNASGTLTIYEEDDTTSFGTQTSTGDAAADPITELNTD